MYKCPRCGNEDRRYIGYRNGEPYCRRCISFSGKEATYEVDLKGKNPNLFLDYSLSEDQKKVSKDVLRILKDGKNVLIYAVTGAGKTELVYESIEYFLKKQKKVGFAIPRRDVVIDLLPRVKEAFKGVKVIAVYGSHSSDIEGDIILLTTHQLYRYKNYFDLLIIDEIDAFPYRGSEVLQSFFKSSLRGNFILLTATPTVKDEEYIKENNGEIVTLLKRYHSHPLIVPRFIKPTISLYISCLIELKRLTAKRYPVMVFVPTIKIGQTLFRFLSFHLKNGQFVSSEEEKRDEYIKAFKERKLNYLVTTSILERGVTIANLQVIVFKSNHKLYTKEALIQISGRVGRKMNAYLGEVLFIGDYLNEANRRAIEEIEETNRKANL